MDFGVIVTGLWALASAGVWGSVLSDSWGLWKEYHDRRAKREVVYSAALFLVALACCVSIIALIVARDVPGVRGVAAAFALGGFLGAGIVIKTFSGPRNQPRQ